MTSFSPVHTIGNQIIETIQLHQQVSKARRATRAIEMLRRVGVSRPERRVDEYAFQLSGGLRQRAMIAMALSCDPSMLIADEPTTALDVTTQAQILDLLRELQAREGMAIVLITHDLGVIAEMSDEVVVMYLGRVVEEGPVDAIFHDPRHPYTQALLRSIPSIQAPAPDQAPDDRRLHPAPVQPAAGLPVPPALPGLHAGDLRRAPSRRWSAVARRPGRELLPLPREPAVRRP